MLRRLILRGIRPYTTATSSLSTTVDTKEIEHFRQYANDWWDDRDKWRPLHSMNKLRIPFIRDGLINSGAVPAENIDSPEPLKGLSILDVGCGGGILTEPLARIGGDITGLDPNPKLIEVAKAHAEKENLPNLRYFSVSVEEHSKEFKGKYDALVASETIEHVLNQDQFIKASVECLKPGGSIFITTMNKTWLSNFLGIFLAEDVLNLVPQGTHHHEKFLEPHKLQRMLEDENCKTLLIHGMIYIPFINKWQWCSDKSVNYALHAVKVQSEPQK